MTGGRSRLGLCSVTLRALPVADVVAVAGGAGLAAIEWGADVHVPVGDERTAGDTASRTADAGLGCASYGSYFRAGPDDADRFEPVLRTAVALGAPRIRIWAGDRSSADTAPHERRRVAEVARAAAGRAADLGLEVGLEFHGGTLTDTVDSTLRLLDDVGHPALRTYWQPPQDVADDEALAGLAALGGRVCAVHAFSWWPGATRLPLRERPGLWRGAAALLAGRGLDVLLEFVVDDDPALVAGEAGSLRDLLGGT